MVSDAIKAAILAGEAELQAKKAAEDAKKTKEAAEHAAYRAKCFAEAESWVTDILPSKIKELTASGIRYLDVDEYQAYWCKLAGLEVESTWLSESYDEGVTYGGYTAYTVKW